jgi:hypothetical protein
MAESTLTLCQSRLYPPVRDLGFGRGPPLSCVRGRGTALNMAALQIEKMRIF